MKNKKVVGGLALLIIVLVAIYLVSNKPVSKPNIEVEKPSEEVVIKENNPEGLSCYDVITQIMEQPQYWDEEHMPKYSHEQMRKEAEEVLVNGTGWRLVDENTASFKRGYQGTVELIFSKYAAIRDFDEPYQAYEVSYYTYNDYVNREVIKYWADGKIDYLGGDKNSELTWHYGPDGYYAPVEEKNKRLPEENYYQFLDRISSYGYFERDHPYTVLETYFIDYEARFKQAGCPLLNQPEGTLTKYKNVKAKDVSPIEKPKPEDGLIHAPWDMEIWGENIWTNDDIVKLDNYMDIYDVELEVYDDKTDKFWSNGELIGEWRVYNPLYVIWTEKSLEYPTETIFNEHGWSVQKQEYFAMYFLNEACKAFTPDKRNCVYVVDMDKETYLKNPNRGAAIGTIPGYGVDTYQKYYNDSGFSDIVGFWADPNGHKVGNAMTNSSFDVDIYRTMAKDVVELCLHYDIPMPFGRDFIRNMLMAFDRDVQRNYGLR